MDPIVQHILRQFALVEAVRFLGCILIVICAFLIGFLLALFSCNSARKGVLTCLHAHSILIGVRWAAFMSLVLLGMKTSAFSFDRRENSRT